MYIRNGRELAFIMKFYRVGERPPSSYKYQHHFKSCCRVGKNSTSDLPQAQAEDPGVSKSSPTTSGGEHPSFSEITHYTSKSCFQWWTRILRATFRRRKPRTGERKKSSPTTSFNKSLNFHHRPIKGIAETVIERTNIGTFFLQCLLQLRRRRM
jgi:hypothetical protein